MAEEPPEQTGSSDFSGNPGNFRSPLPYEQSLDPNSAPAEPNPTGVAEGLSVSEESPQPQPDDQLKDGWNFGYETDSGHVVIRRGNESKLIDKDAYQQLREINPKDEIEKAAAGMNSQAEALSNRLDEIIPEQNDSTDSSVRSEQQDGSKEEIEELKNRIEELEQERENDRREAERRHQELLDEIKSLGGAGGEEPPEPPESPPVEEPPEPEPEPESEPEPEPEPAQTTSAEPAPPQQAEAPELGAVPNSEPRSAAALGELNTSRDDLVRFTILRRARSWDGFTARRREDAEAYDRAYEAYLQNKSAYLQALRDEQEAGGLNAQQIIDQHLAPAEYRLQREFAQAVYDIDQQNYEESQRAGGFRAWRERQLKRWANLSTRRKLMIGLAVGVGAGVASGALGLGLFGLAAGSAARYSVGILNRVASARNVSERSRDQEVVRVQREESRERTNRARSRLRLGALDTDEYLAGLADRTEGYHGGEMRRARRRNRIGLAIMAAGAVSSVIGGAELAGLDLPRLPRFWDIFDNHGGAGGNSIDMSNFHPDSFRGPTGDDAVRNALHVLERNDMQVSGVSPDKIHAISQQLAGQHFHMASGMEAAPGGGLQQHIVDWTTGRVSNAGASNLQGFEKTGGSSVDAWADFIKIAQNNGVSITQ